MKKLLFLSCLFLIPAALTACGPGQALGPTLTAEPTVTLTAPPPTSTPMPTPIGSGQGGIAFARQCPGKPESYYEIFMVWPDGSEEQLTSHSDETVGFWDTQWSPDGSSLFYTKSDGNIETIYRMNIDGTNVQKLSQIPAQFSANSLAQFYEYGIAVSPSGLAIAFGSTRHSGIYATDLEVFSMDLETLEITQLTSAYGYSYQPAWSPLGDKIAFMSDRDGDWEIYIMDIDGKNVVQITKNTYADRYPDWSSDGRYLVYHSDRSGNYDLILFDLETEEETQLTMNPASDSSADFSPDDAYLAFISDRDGDYEIFILNLGTMEEWQVTNNECNDSFVDWRP